MISAGDFGVFEGPERLQRERLLADETSDRISSELLYGEDGNPGHLRV